MTFVHFLNFLSLLNNFYLFFVCLYQDHSKQKTQESTRIAEVQEVISEALAV